MSSRGKDPIERMAEEDVAEMRKILEQARAEVERSKAIADKLERRAPPQPERDKNGKTK